MALNNRKITTYANPVANLPDHPSQAGFTAAQLKAFFDAKANEEIKAAINGIIDDLIAVIDSASGADNIGATAITDLDGATVQAILESMRNKLKSVIDNSSGADFVGATAISGLTGATVQTILESLKLFIDTHKLATSSDHDGRYYTETELNAIDGIKGSALIGTPAITGVSGTTVKEQLASLKSLITSVVLGQIPDNSLTNAKLGSDVKVGSLAELITTVKTSLVAAINEVKEQNNDLGALVGLGGVVESGANENGRYIKFEDGTMICTSSYTEAITTSIDGITHTMYSVAHTLPATFLAGYAPILFVESPDVSYIGNAAISVGQTAYYLFYHFNKALTNSVIGFSILAIGRWK